uniref:Laminin IV type A domain-containing protein n=1 Tax=Hemiselmis andersenii TaxID=464988 RepID=A0A7S1E593_HEMAN
MARQSMPCALQALLLFSLALLQLVSAGTGDVIAASDFRLGTQDWELEGSGWSSEGLQSEGDLIAAVDSPTSPSSTWYYSAPSTFIDGDKAMAYNGFLSFDFGHFEYESMGEGTMPGYDIMLYGRNKKQTLGIKGIFQMDETKLSKTYNVRLEETFAANNSAAMWELVNVLKPVEGKLVTKAPTQHEFLATLQSLSAIWIRGSYFKGSEATWLKNVKIVRGVITKGTAAGREETELVNGVTSRVAATTPAADSGCCASKTCVTNDYYEIDFDRPGCMQAPDYQCYMPQATDTIDKTGAARYFKTYDESSAAEITRGTDYNEGRAFMLPGTVSPCWGAGPVSATKSACLMAGDNPGTVPSSGAGTGFARWDSGTKNQNMGMMGTPLRKPFVKDYYMNSLPRICSAATLTVSVHGDIADPLDYIEVYGEDEEYLGKLFAGNLTYMYEGQRAYDANTDIWDCDGPYDPNVASTATNVRLADPHHPSGTWAKVPGYRGGVDAQPGVYGKENTKCVKWQKYGDKNPSLEHSESMPYVDSIPIPAEKMMQFTSDEQMKLTFRTWRNGAVSNVFTGTGGGGVTGNCFFSNSANSCGAGVACDGCDLDGKVLFRSIKLKFSTAACYVKKLATDKMETFMEGVHSTQPLNVSMSFSVPSGTTGLPGGDAALSVVVGADIFGRDKFMSVYTAAGVKLGDLFRQESSGSLRSRTSDDLMVQTTSFGATDSPTPFRTATDCDTTSPITKTDYCTPADTQWQMGETFVNYTDTLLIPRATIQSLESNGKIMLYLQSDVPGNAFSPSSGGFARISPITLTFPLLHCFQKAIKTGANFGIYLERPRSYYFHEMDFPVPAGDVTIFFAAHWNRHVRYVTRHVGPAAATAANAYDGLQDGLSVSRVDKDTVAEMGTVWVYQDQDGQDCCPAIYRPEFAGKKFQIPVSTNCIGGTCTDPDLSTADLCTHSTPCVTSALTAAASTTSVTLDGGASAVSGVYVGLKIVFSALLTTTTSGSAGFGCTASQTNSACRLEGGGGDLTGFACLYSTDANGAVSAGPTITVGTGKFQSAPVVIPASGDSCTSFYYTVTLDTTDIAAADVGVSNAKTIIAYDGTTKIATLGSALAGTPATATNLGYRVTGEGIASFPKNTLDGGTATGTVVVPLPSDAQCQTRYIASGYVEVLNAAATTARLDTAEASANNDAYTGMTIEVLYGPSGWQSSTISAYQGYARGIIGGTGTQATTTTVVLQTAGGLTTFPWVSDLTTAPVAGVDDAYLRPQSTAARRGLTIEIDIDGNPDTGDDVYTTTVSDYVHATLTLTFDAIARTPKDGVSTIKVFTRTATVSGLTVTGTGSGYRASPIHTQLQSGSRAFDQAAAAGLGQFQLRTTADADQDSSTAGQYNDHKIVVTHATGSVYEYTIVDHSPSVAMTAALGTGTGGYYVNVERPLDEAIVVGDTYVIYRPFRIFQRLSPTGSDTCLVGSDLRITYTVGTAATVANEPGELQKIYSNWDRSTGNAVSFATTPVAGQQTGVPSTRDVRSWMIKLTGEGYYTSIYRQQGVGSFQLTALGATLANAATAMTVTSTSGMSVGMYLLLVDGSNRESVKIDAVLTATTLTVSRGQLGSVDSATTFTTATTVTPTGNNADGSGYDDMAAFGGVSRPTITEDDAYAGLNITITDGMGAGQSRIISTYHGASRTAYLTKAWDIIPDATSKYEIWYAALIGGVEKPAIPAAMPTMAIATFPRPVRQGYLWRVEWFDCAQAVVNAEGASGDHNSNSLPQCPGSLRMRIPKQGPATDYSLTSTLNRAQAQIFHTMREVDITRQEYPDMIEQHKVWPHGYNYLKLQAGEDGELLGNVFLKDYTQYSTMAYYTDTVTIPKDRFETYVRQGGDFRFTLATPPGKGNIELRSIVISYPVTKEEDASSYDADDIVQTPPLSSHGPPPFFPQSVAWTGADESTRVGATHPRFQTHSYTSTCGNGQINGNEYCDDGNEVDGDGCSSSCTQEVGWMCITPFTDQPSTCSLGAQGARIADSAVGCKYYACYSANAAYTKNGVPCSGKIVTTAGDAGPAVCLDGAIQGTCTTCVGWGNDPTNNGIDSYAGRTAYRR